MIDLGPDLKGLGPNDPIPRDLFWVLGVQSYGLELLGDHLKKSPRKRWIAMISQHLILPIWFGIGMQIAIEVKPMDGRTYQIASDWLADMSSPITLELQVGSKGLQEIS